MEHGPFEASSASGVSVGGASCPPIPEPSQVCDIMRYGVVTIGPETSGHEAIRLLVEKDISGLPVVDDTTLMGMISEKDILRMVVQRDAVPALASDVMTADVVTCEEDESISEICTCLAANAFRHIPVMRWGKLAGMVSRSDLIRTYKDRFRPKDVSSESATHVGGPAARDVMTYGLLTVTPQTPMYQAMAMLASHDITGLPVVDDGLHLVGILSEKDIIKVLCDPQAGPKCVDELMTADVVSFTEDDSLWDICDCLATRDFRRVPILSDGRLTGLVSRRDLIVFLLKNRSFVSSRRTAR